MFDFLKNIFIFAIGIISVIASPFTSTDKIKPSVSLTPVVQEVRQKPPPTAAPIIDEKEVKDIKWPTPTPTTTSPFTPTLTPIDIPSTILQLNSRSDAYWNFQIKQAEKEAKEAEEARKTREAYDQQCKELKAQRGAVLAPLEAQITETKNKLWTVEERVNERTKGTLTSKSQRLRTIEAETHELQNQLNKLQNEYNAIYSQFGSC